MKIKNGCLTLENYDIDHIKGWIDEDGYSPKEALKNEVELSGLEMKDIRDIQLNGSQMSNQEYLEVYCKVVADMWNKK